MFWLLSLSTFSFIYQPLQNPVNLNFSYLDVLTNLTIKLWVGKKFETSKRSNLYGNNTLAVYKYTILFDPFSDPVS